MSNMIQFHTKGVVESGSNSNGNYVKFSDGTMICTYNQSISGLSPTGYAVQGLNVYRAVWTWTFPATFTNTPSVVGSPRLYNAGAAVAAHVGALYPASTTTADTKIVIEALLTFDTLVEPALIAIGKWK